MADHGDRVPRRDKFFGFLRSPHPQSPTADASTAPRPPLSESVPQPSQEPGANRQGETKRNLSKEAFDRLPAETQEEVQKLIPHADLGANDFTSSVPDQIHALIGIVQTKEEECEKKFWKINIGGNDIVIRDYVKSTLKVLQQVGDVAINFAPAPGSIVWSGVKTIMQASNIINPILSCF